MKDGKTGPVLVRDVLLYSIDSSCELIYDVIDHAGAVSASVIDHSGHGIIDMDILEDVLNQQKLNIVADLKFAESEVISEIQIKSCTPKPVVGISWKSDNQDYHYFLEALRRNGAIAVELPRIPDPAAASEALEKIDGVMVTGGEDIDPELYGEEMGPYHYGFNRERDESDILLIQKAITADIPLLAICRGAQVLNIALGGGLIQDIPSYLGEKVLSGEIDRSRAEPVSEVPGNGSGPRNGASAPYRVWVDHVIHGGGTGYHEVNQICRDSKWLYDIVGDTRIQIAATAHHQAINPERLGRGLSIASYSSDGIIEGIEYRDNLFALGVQTHPERDTLENTHGTQVDQKLCNRFLRTLVQYAGIYAEGKTQAF